MMNTMFQPHSVRNIQSRTDSTFLGLQQRDERGNVAWLAHDLIDITTDA